tara:strand:+ start:102 stop:953 length:852 start_codon:yes stop_codon:yes gene_type:complete
LNGQDTITSRLEVFNIYEKSRKVIYEKKIHFEAPNWSNDGKYLIFNQQGYLYKLNLNSSSPIVIDTDFATRCNNDHGISPLGDMLVISHAEKKSNLSLIYTLPINGGIPKLITNKGPSYWHGWSPDGKFLTYCANRNNNYDVYIIPTTGGEEIRLTNAQGLDDGPDYSPDGKYIYFNSVRTGKMKIWRMNNDGSNQQQITFDTYNDWFPHPSPDGKWIVFLSYIDKVDPGSHPAFKRVMLRMISTVDAKPVMLTKLFGGQGTINVPSWSPDSKKFAFVSYELE